VGVGSKGPPGSAAAAAAAGAGAGAGAEAGALVGERARSFSARSTTHAATSSYLSHDFERRLAEEAFNAFVKDDDDECSARGEDEGADEDEDEGEGEGDAGAGAGAGRRTSSATGSA
jgi:hypothetical protein